MKIAKRCLYIDRGLKKHQACFNQQFAAKAVHYKIFTSDVSIYMEKFKSPCCSSTHIEFQQNTQKLL